jgi:hypothetical protein
MLSAGNALDPAPQPSIPEMSTSISPPAEVGVYPREFRKERSIGMINFEF